MPVACGDFRSSVVSSNGSGAFGPPGIDVVSGNPVPMVSSGSAQIFVAMIEKIDERFINAHRREILECGGGGGRHVPSSNRSK